MRSVPRPFVNPYCSSLNLIVGLICWQIHLSRMFMMMCLSAIGRQFLGSSLSPFLCRRHMFDWVIALGSWSGLWTILFKIWYIWLRQTSAPHLTTSGVIFPQAALFKSIPQITSWTSSHLTWIATYSTCSMVASQSLIARSLYLLCCSWYSPSQKCLNRSVRVLSNWIMFLLFFLCCQLKQFHTPFIPPWLSLSRNSLNYLFLSNFICLYHFLRYVMNCLVLFRILLAIPIIFFVLVHILISLLKVLLIFFLNFRALVGSLFFICLIYSCLL